jgi:hypothetical protein
MPKTTLFETHLRLVTEYVNDKGEEFDKYDYIKSGMIFTMNYTQTHNYISEEATIKVAVVSVTTVIDDDYPEIYVLGCVLKPEILIYVCEFGAYLARGITIHTETTTIATGHVLKIIG